MLTARAGHLLHPEYLQPLPSTPVSPIEVSTKMEIWAKQASVLYILKCCTLKIKLLKNNNKKVMKVPHKSGLLTKIDFFIDSFLIHVHVLCLFFGGWGGGPC